MTTVSEHKAKQEFPKCNLPWDKIRDRVTKARVKLLLQHPFFGNLATRLKIIDATDRIPTAAVDGRNLFINRDFVHALTDGELMFLIAHEVMHCVFEHMIRRGEREPQVWNMAGDYVINVGRGGTKSVNNDDAGDNGITSSFIGNNIDIKAAGGGGGGSYNYNNGPAPSIETYINPLSK